LPVHHAHQLPQNTAAAWHMALPMVQQLEAKTKLRDNSVDELYSSVCLLLPVSQLVLFSLDCVSLWTCFIVSLSPPSCSSCMGREKLMKYFHLVTLF
jgi:hypothetical protein